jgi:3-phosphoshikimate 1-carboxyvinyltransferase
MLMGCGAAVSTVGLTTTLRAPARLESQRLNVPADFSSAAFFIVAGLLGGGGEGLLIRNVGVNPTRSGLLDILRSMGGDITILEVRDSGAEPVADLAIRRSTLHGIAVPAALVPIAIDEFPVLFVAAACARGETLVTGAEELRVKESDRIAAMSGGFQTLGVVHEVLPDGMRIEGRPEGRAFGGGVIDSRGDHRVAMAFAIASLRAAAPIRIRDVDNVATSFPGFAAVARSIGLDVVEASGG